MKTTLILLSLLAIVFAVSQHADVRQQFLAFQQKYHRVYKTAAEFEHRFNVFQENLRKAAVHQSKNPKATFGVTKFSDLTEEEFSNFYLMSNVDAKSWVKPAAKNFSIEGPKNKAGCSPNPTTFDWFTCGVCTPIYNQGQCGSCWAFSATETIESYYVIDTGAPVTSLSMEQIVDCDTSDSGCGGGNPTTAYQYVQSAGGIELYSDYPYIAEGGESGTCSFNSADVVATVSSQAAINGETGLYQQASSSSGGPVSVCVDASSWSAYTGGVLTSCGNDVDHCVQLTGYNGYGQSGSYWIVRNSWGTDWGLSGFIWIEIGQDLCSIGDYATVVVSAKAS